MNALHRAVNHIVGAMSSITLKGINDYSIGARYQRNNPTGPLPFVGKLHQKGKYTRSKLHEHLRSPIDVSREVFPN